MSPEYNFYLEANLSNDGEAEILAKKLREMEGVEIVSATSPIELVRQMSLGEFVCFYRIQSGLSLSQLSTLSDLSVDTISDIEKGERIHRIKDTTASKLLGGFGFKPDDPRAMLFHEKLEQANSPK